MTEPTSSPPPTDPSPTATPGPDATNPVERLSRYLEQQGDRYTEEALTRAARDAGYTDAQIEQAIASVRGRVPAAPTRRRATRVVLAAYLVTYLVLAGGMFASEYARRYNGHLIGSMILAIVVGLALLISTWWLRSMGRSTGPVTGLAALLSLPMVLLVIVAGLCISTGYPIPRPY